MTYEQYTNGRDTLAPRSSQEIQSDLQDIRGEIKSTLDALTGQLQPGQLLNQIYHAVRGGRGGGQFWRNLSQAVESNPLPIALIGAGFGYLMYSDAQRRRGYHIEGGSGESSTTEHLREGVDRARGAAHSGSEKLRKGAQRVREIGEGAQQGAHRLREGAHDLSENVRSKMHGVVDATREELHHTGERARDITKRGRDLIHEQPLILAGLGLAVGAALAALAPMTRREHQVLGEAGREAKGQTRGFAEEAMGTAKSTAQEAVRAVKSETLGERGEQRPYTP